jgi:transcriptional regulator with XRE-family HTH domain
MADGGSRCVAPSAGRFDLGGAVGEFHPARKRTEVSVGESLRILRELQELSQNQLSELTGISQATISAIENGRVNLGVERAKVLARALKCHPAVLLFPGWEVALDSAAWCAAPATAGTRACVRMFRGAADARRAHTPLEALREHQAPVRD